MVTSSLRYVLPLCVGVFAVSGAQALVINPIFDSSITSRSNAQVIESAFNQVAQTYASNLHGAGTINVGVSWGKVDGYAMSSGALGSSMDMLYFSSYAQVKALELSSAQAQGATSPLWSAVNALPALAPAGVSRYVIPSAEAKALGLINAYQAGTDGYVGFGSGVSYTFDPTNGVAAGTYDFQAVAAHELDEVLGRLSGLSSTSPTWRSPFDLFRYSAPGQLSFSYTAPAYFSTNGGITNEGSFNVGSGGDRGDWANYGATVNDIQDAFLAAGHRANLTAADFTVLNDLGYGGGNVGVTQVWNPTYSAHAFLQGVPEPQSWALMLVGVGAIGSTHRQRRRYRGKAATAAPNAALN